MELCGMRDGLPLHVLAHELAHAVAFSSLERGKVPIEKTVCAWRSAHGPFFVGVFSYLLGALIGVDSRKIAVTFEAYGVACVDPYGVAPDTIDATVAEWYAQECEVNGAPA
jgi:hypothetical protein